ncbi:MAG: PilT/PilU family type 4a pilus ATPase [Enterococcus sp.]|nr:PilT/PilU family type 4a pilus ATPase [Enterococcus sp.]
MTTAFTIENIFAAAAKNGASDIYLTPNSLPILRIKNEFKKIKGEILTPSDCNELILSSMTPEQQEEFIRERDYDYAVNLENIGRFRVNVFVAQGAYEMVARLVAGTPKDITTLGLPEVITEIADRERTGLILVTGATGSGKTMTLAGIIDRINATRAAKIITIEDPIEIVHPNKRSSVSQRELYADTKNFSSALKGAMRQRPDVILIGEMRDAETVSTAISASESGHLVLSTLHSINAMDTVGRILDFYPQDEQQQIRNLLSSTLRSIISQRLIVSEEGQTKPLCEVLVQSGRVADAIRDPDKTHDLNHIMEESNFEKMQTFNKALENMVADEILSAERSMEYSDNPHELKRALKQNGLL